MHDIISILSKTTVACFVAQHVIYSRKCSVYTWRECVFCCFQMECSKESILLKCPYWPRQSTDSMKSLLKYQWCFSKNRKNNFKICMEIQKTSYSQNNLEKEQSWRNHTPWLQTILQSYIVIKAVSHWHKNKHR